MSDLPECRGACCKNPTGTCFHRHQCTHHAAETRATIAHTLTYRDKTGDTAAARVDRSRRKQRKP